MYPELRTTEAVTIASGASLSAAIELKGTVPVAIVMPATWTAAALTFQGSADGVTYGNVYSTGGSEMTAQAAATRFILLEPADFVAIRWLKVRSGTSGTPVNQAAERTLTVVERPV